MTPIPWYEEFNRNTHTILFVCTHTSPTPQTTASRLHHTSTSPTPHSLFTRYSAVLYLHPSRTTLALHTTTASRIMNNSICFFTSNRCHPSVLHCPSHQSSLEIVSQGRSFVNKVKVWLKWSWSGYSLVAGPTHLRNLNDPHYIQFTDNNDLLTWLPSITNKQYKEWL